jgi:hypothetical protein
MKKKCAYILIEFEKITLGRAAYNKENKNSNISRKRAVSKGHNSYDDLQLKLSDTHRLKPLRSMFLLFIAIYK